MQTPEISVIIPVFNSGKYISHCLSCVTGQTVKNIEIICIDDGSTDDSAKIISEFAKTDNRIRLISQKNQGPSSARNAGLKIARGNYIHFMDSDDELSSPRYYEQMIFWINRYDSDMVSSGYKNESGGFLESRIHHAPNLLVHLNDKIRGSNIHLKQYFYIWHYLFRRNFIEKHKLKFIEELRSSEDSPFIVSAIFYANNIIIAPDVLYIHKKNENSILSATDPKEKLKLHSDWLKSRGFVLGFAMDHGFFQEFWEAERFLFKNRLSFLFMNYVFFNEFLQRLRNRVWNIIGDKLRNKYKTENANYTMRDLHYESLMDFKQLKICDGIPEKEFPVVVCCIKNEIDKISEFLNHYRHLGVKRFALIDNCSTDGSLEFIIDQPDCDVYQVSDEYNYIKQNTWRAHICDLYNKKCGRPMWYLGVDSDELVVYQDSENITIDKFIKKVKRHGNFHIRGQLVDMYPDGEILNTKYDNSKSLIKNCPFFDKDFIEQTTFTKLKSRFGGPRFRLFKNEYGVQLAPQLSKIPLFLWKSGEQCGSHFFKPDFLNLSPCYIGILHFKFLPGSMEKFKNFSETGIHWNGSSEYKAYTLKFTENPNLSFMYKDSIKFESSHDLVRTKIIKPWH